MLNDSENKGDVVMVDNADGDEQAYEYNEEYNTATDDNPPAADVKQMSTEEATEKAKAVAGKVVEAVSTKYGGTIGWIFIASLVLTIEASVDCSRLRNCNGIRGYAVAAGVVPLFLTFAYLVLDKMGKFPEGKQKPKQLLAAIMLVWWTISVIVLTFVQQLNLASPYTYVGVWGGFYASFLLAGEVLISFDSLYSKAESMNQHSLMVLVASIVVLCASISPCSVRFGGCGGIEAYAVAVGVVGVVLSFVLIRQSGNFSAKALLGALAFQALWWSVAVILLTFIGPFGSIGNGFFGCWAAAIGSVLLYISAKEYGDIDTSNDTQEQAAPASPSGTEV